MTEALSAIHCRSVGWFNGYHTFNPPVISTRFCSVRFEAKRYILRSLKELKGSYLLGTRWYNF